MLKGIFVYLVTSIRSPTSAMLELHRFCDRAKKRAFEMNCVSVRTEGGSHDLSASRSDAGADFLDLKSSDVRRSIRWLFINSSANSPSLVRKASIKA